jgi:FMN phosphatase YigB (HAD superfamily)
METFSPQVPQALLFDVGGVLVDIEFERALSAWEAISPLSWSELQRRFTVDHAYEQHERGEISTREYFQHLSSELQILGTMEQIEYGWNSILVAEITETLSLVARASEAVPCYGFSNTNSAHVSHWETLCPNLSATLQEIFVSHRIGSRKPEAHSFLHVCERIATPPEAVLFFDDSLINVEAARAVGMDAVLVEDPQSVEQALFSRGVLRQGGEFNHQVRQRSVAK